MNLDKEIETRSTNRVHKKMKETGPNLKNLERRK